MKTLLVTGTDTNVGKTWVTSLLVRDFRRCGINTGAYKPVCSGAEQNSEGDVVWADVEALRAACGTDPEIDLVCPQRFHAAVAPNIAARMENRCVDSRLLIDGAARWSSHVDQLVIEGAGGIFCPLSDQLTVMNIAVELRTPTIVVAANRLGVINHTRLTVNALQAHGVDVIAVVLNEISPPAQEKSDPSVPSNAAQIRHWLPELPLYQCAWQGTEIIGPAAAVSPDRSSEMTATRYLVKWTLLASILGAMTGSSCALFLWLLDHCSRLQAENSWSLWLLPVAGVLIGLVYSTIGKSTELGNNLILNEIHEPGNGVPLRMAPLVLLSTLVTHLFGGSAGREGTAVQMGGSLAAGLSRMIPSLSGEDRKILLTAGIASGFAGVFGTPVAGMIFAMEVLTVGRLNSTSILPCMIAAMIGDQACVAWGIEHTHYSIASSIPAGTAAHLAPVDGRVLLCTAIAGLAFGLSSLMFSEDHIS